MAVTEHRLLPPLSQHLQIAASGVREHDFSSQTSARDALHHPIPLRKALSSGVMSLNSMLSPPSAADDVVAKPRLPPIVDAHNGSGGSSNAHTHRHHHQLALNASPSSGHSSHSSQLLLQQQPPSLQPSSSSSSRSEAPPEMSLSFARNEETTRAYMARKIGLREHLMAAQAVDPSRHHHEPLQESYNSSQGSNAPTDPTIPYPPNSTASSNVFDPAMEASGYGPAVGEPSGDDLLGLDGKRNAKRELSSSKRAAQNRAAQVRSLSLARRTSPASVLIPTQQRAFRQRKEEYIKQLEERAKDKEVLEQSYSVTSSENYHLREYIVQLQQRLLTTEGKYPKPPDGLTIRDAHTDEPLHLRQAPPAMVTPSGISTLPPPPTMSQYHQQLPPLPSHSSLHQPHPLDRPTFNLPPTLRTLSQDDALSLNRDVPATTHRDQSSRDAQSRELPTEPRREPQKELSPDEPLHLRPMMLSSPSGSVPASAPVPANAGSSASQSVELAPLRVTINNKRPAEPAEPAARSGSDDKRARTEDPPDQSV